MTGAETNAKNLASIWSQRTYSIREMSSELGLSTNADASEARENQNFETEDKHTQFPRHRKQ